MGAGLVLAWLLAGSIARPVEKLRTAAGRLGRGDLDARVDPEGPQELDELGQTFNRMAGALSSNLERPARLRRQRLPPAPHASDGDQAPPRGDPRRGRDRPPRRRPRRRRSSTGSARSWTTCSRSPGPPPRRPSPSRSTWATRSGPPSRRWAEPAATAGHDLALADGQGGRILAAPADIAHILDNLIENAIRYSPTGAQITVATEPGAFLVSDTGPGIPAAERERVFERFYRGAGGRTSGPGTGLGLAIVAELAERWGGRVELLDGPGTRVRARFPADSSPRPNHS